MSVFDNGTSLGRAPRAVRYRVNTSENTATLVESLADSEITASSCCGGARKLGSNGWLVAWGGQPVFAEYGADGSRVFKLQIPGANTYRAVPVPTTRIGAAQLRSAMDSMFPRDP